MSYKNIIEFHVKKKRQISNKVMIYTSLYVKVHKIFNRKRVINLQISNKVMIYTCLYVKVHKIFNRKRVINLQISNKVMIYTCLYVKVHKIFNRKRVINLQVINKNLIKLQIRELLYKMGSLTKGHQKINIKREVKV